MTTPVELKPLNSYLLQAYYNWLLASGRRVFIATDGALAQPELKSYVRNGLLILNISARAAPVVTITEEYLNTKMTFGGRQVEVWVPMHAIKSIYDPETNIGSMLPEMDAITIEETPPNKPRPSLSVVK